MFKYLENYYKKQNIKYMNKVFRVFIASQYKLQDDSSFIVTKNLKVIPRVIGCSYIDHDTDVEIYEYRQFSEEKTMKLRLMLIDIAEYTIVILKDMDLWLYSRISLMALCISILKKTIKIPMFFKDDKKIIQDVLKYIKIYTKVLDNNKIIKKYDYSSLLPKYKIDRSKIAYPFPKPKLEPKSDINTNININVNVTYL